MTTANHTKSESDLDPEHLQAIRAPAEEIDCPVEEVNNICASALQSLKSRTRVRNYLTVLVGRKVRDE